MDHQLHQQQLHHRPPPLPPLINIPTSFNQHSFIKAEVMDLHHPHQPLDLHLQHQTAASSTTSPQSTSSITPTSTHHIMASSNQGNILQPNIKYDPLSKTITIISLLSNFIL